MGEFWGHVRTKIGVGFGQNILFSEIGPPGFTPSGFGRTLKKFMCSKFMCLSLALDSRLPPDMRLQIPSRTEDWGGGGGIRICLPGHCLSLLPSQQP